MAYDLSAAVSTFVASHRTHTSLFGWRNSSSPGVPSTARTTYIGLHIVTFATLGRVEMTPDISAALPSEELAALAKAFTTTFGMGYYLAPLYDLILHVAGPPLIGSWILLFLIGSACTQV